MIQGTMCSIVQERRICTGKRSSGRPLAMDESDENFLLQCSESKTTADGRRQDQVMYTGRRVNKRDFFFRFVNHNCESRNLKPINSATTAYNRSRPHNIKSVQAKNYLGSGLFCTKKPPKTANNENELTHYQRAHNYYYYYYYYY